MITCNEAGTVARRSQLLKRLGAGAHARVATPPSPTLRAPLWYKPATTVQPKCEDAKRSPVFSFMIRGFHHTARGHRLSSWVAGRGAGREQATAELFRTFIQSLAV